MPVHRVQKGEYLSLIGARYGIPWKRIWDDPANRDLRDRRKDPNILHAGDRLTIPDRELHEESAVTEKRHRFRFLGAGNTIRVVLRDEMGDPISGLDYELHVASRPAIRGKTGSDGLVKAHVPADLEEAQLSLPQLGRVYQLEVGHLDPISRASGVQQRLNNLGFNCGVADGIIGPKTRAALLRFQKWAALKVTGVADESTRSALEKAHEGQSRGLKIEDGTDVPPAHRVVGEESVDRSDDIDKDDSMFDVNED